MNIELEPKLLRGKILKVTEIGVQIELKGRMGLITLPLRSVFTDKKLEENDEVEIYMSYAKVL